MCTWVSWGCEVIIIHLHIRDDSAIPFDLAIETAQYYGITKKEAEKIVGDISTTIRDNWERLASEYGLSKGSIEKMRPAFSACYA